MIVQNKKTKAKYPISKQDFDSLPKERRDGFIIVDDGDLPGQTVTAAPLQVVSTQRTYTKKKADKKAITLEEPKTGEKQKEDGKKS